MVAIEEKIKELFPGLSQLQANALREKKRKASAERERAQENLATLRSDLRVVETEIGSTEELLATYKGQLARDNRGVVLAEHSPCPICEVPLNAILDTGCPCTADTGYLDEVESPGAGFVSDQQRHHAMSSSHTPLSESGSSLLNTLA